MKLIYEKVHNGTHIEVYRKNPNQEIFPIGIISNICEKLFLNVVVKYFRKIEIILLSNSTSGDFKEIMDSAVGNRAFGKVIISDIKQNMSRIYIYEDAIWSYYYNLIREERNQSSPEDKDIVLIKLIKLVEKNTERTILHELMHIWHLRQNNAQHLIERNKRCVEKAWDKVLQDKETIILKAGGLLIYRELRIILLDLLLFINDEGVAVYWEKFSQFKMDSTRESVIAYYTRYGLGEAHKLHDILFNLCEYLSKSDNLKEVKCPDCLSIVVPNYRNGEAKCPTCNKKFAKDDKISDFITYFVEFVKEIPQFGYTIGPHIYHAIIVMFEDMNLTKLAKMRYDKILLLYEDAMHMIGLVPLISIKHDNAIVSYPQFIAVLHSLRKRAMKKTRYKI